MADTNLLSIGYGFLDPATSRTPTKPDAQAAVQDTPQAGAQPSSGAAHAAYAVSTVALRTLLTAQESRDATRLRSFPLVRDEKPAPPAPNAANDNGDAANRLPTAARQPTLAGFTIFAEVLSTPAARMDSAPRGEFARAQRAYLNGGAADGRTYGTIAPGQMMDVSSQGVDILI